jgi:predicted HTH domain antitoxin
MKKTISIEYPESLANSLRLAGKDFENEMKRSALVKLYEMGKISSGMAAKVLELSRIDFLDLLAAYSVSSLGVNEPDDLNEDIENA